jgi:hypothetical protein
MNYDTSIIIVLISIILNIIGLTDPIKSGDVHGIVIETAFLLLTLIAAYLCFINKNCKALRWFFLGIGILRLIVSSIMLYGKTSSEVISVLNMLLAVSMIYLGSKNISH